MRKRGLPKSFVDKLKSVTGKRARTVIDHILKHGHITTEDLNATYGYDHPPRAVRDVREQGIPIERFPAVGKHGRKIAAYRFGDPADIRGVAHGGRHQFTKKFKALLVSACNSKCTFCCATFDSSHLQLDHRIPYEVAGDPSGEPKIRDHALACGSCNRTKSWCCEHCENWTAIKDPKFCKTCYWASPEQYTHIALMPIRRLELVWVDTETAEYDNLKQMATAAGKPIHEVAKQLLAKSTRVPQQQRK